MVTRFKLFRKIEVEGKHLLVGMPGMGRVGYLMANFFIEKLNAELVCEIYSTSFPPQIIVSKGGFSSLFKGKLYSSDKMIILTADTQPPTTEGQNEVCDAILSLLSKDGLKSVIAGAAFVVPQVGTVRKVFVAGNEDELIKKFVSLGATPLNEGVISGINGAIVGWSSYYGIPSAVILGETWAPIVEFDEVDYRAAKYVIELVAKYLSEKIDTSDLDLLANGVEGRVIKALSQATKLSKISKKEPPREIM